jgi:hypothetical protein
MGTGLVVSGPTKKRYSERVNRSYID